MSFDVVDIDHLMIRVADLQTGVETYESFGFTVAPERRNVGMASLTGGGDDAAAPPKAPFNNRLILFKPFPGRDDVANFLELMCMEVQFGIPVPVTRLMSFMWDTEGPKTVVCYTYDLERTRAAMLEAGVESEAPPSRFETGWDDAETGRFIPIKAQPCVPLFRQTPFMVNAYETTTLESFRHEPWTVHPNTAQYLAGVTGVTDDLEGHVAWMAERVFGVKPEWVSEHCALVWARDLYLRIVSPAGFAELYPGLDFSTERVLPALSGATVAVTSLDAVREILVANGIAHVDTPTGGVAIPRHAAANTIVEFVSA
jgi:hypothetical protein